jgi:hypothetical protein
VKNLRIFGLRTEIWNRDLPYTKEGCYPRDQDIRSVSFCKQYGATFLETSRTYTEHVWEKGAVEDIWAEEREKL